MIYLHKILPLLSSPLIIVIILILFGIIFKSRIVSTLGIIILVFCSLPIVSNKLIENLEKDYEPIEISKIENSDAIVVLSGMLKQIKYKNSIKYEFDEKVDRIIAGIDLFKNKKAPILVLTRGKLPWTIGIPEGEFLKKFAINQGIPEKNIFLTESVQNTEEEALSVKKMFSNTNVKIILVTSAFHMNRAKRIFEKKGIKVLPFPVDFINSETKFTVITLLPSVYALTDTSKFIREMIGRAYYNLRY